MRLTLTFILSLTHSGLHGPVITWVAGDGPHSPRYSRALAYISHIYTHTYTYTDMEES